MKSSLRNNRTPLCWIYGGFSCCCCCRSCSCSDRKHFSNATTTTTWTTRWNAYPIDSVCVFLCLCSRVWASPTFVVFRREWTRVGFSPHHFRNAILDLFWTFSSLCISCFSCLLLLMSISSISTDNRLLLVSRYCCYCCYTKNPLQWQCLCCCHCCSNLSRADIAGYRWIWGGRGHGWVC